MTEENRNYDFVFCVDGTESMAICGENVKSFIHKFMEDFFEFTAKSGWETCSWRAKVILFRDYRHDKQNAFVESPFWEMPKESNALDGFLSQSVFCGGGQSGKSNGVEALYLAMHSDFIATEPGDRQIIVLLTNKDCYGFNECETGMGIDEDGFLEAWYCCDRDGSKLRERNKRLVMVAPFGTEYESFMNKLNRSSFVNIEPKSDLSDIDTSLLF